MRLQRTASDVSHAQPWFEATTLVEPMYPMIVSAALQQDMIATLCPGLRECGVNHGTAMPLSSERWVGDHILKERVSTPDPQEVWCGNQHACRDNPGLGLRDEHGDAVMVERLTPDEPCHIKGLDG